MICFGRRLPPSQAGAAAFGDPHADSAGRARISSCGFYIRGMQTTDSPDVHEALSFLTDKTPALARYVSNKRMACGLIHFNSDFGVAPHVPGLNLTQLLPGEKRMRYFRPIVILIAIATLMG